MRDIEEIEGEKGSKLFHNPKEGQQLLISIYKAQEKDLPCSKDI